MVEVHHTSKQCTACGEVKLLEAFHRQKEGALGRKSRCRTCANIACGVWRSENLDRERTKKREYMRAMYAVAPEKAQEATRKWQAANPDVIARWRKENPAKLAASVRLRQTRKRNACPPWANREVIASFYAEAVRLSVETGVPHHVDHIIPLAGKTVCGLHVPENLQVIPADENRRKSNKVYE